MWQVGRAPGSEGRRLTGRRGRWTGRWAGGETDLYTEVAAVDVVTEEEVLGAGGGAPHLGQGSGAANDDPEFHWYLLVCVGQVGSAVGVLCRGG